MILRRLILACGAWFVAMSLAGCGGPSTGPAQEQHDQGLQEHLTVPAAGADSPLAKKPAKK